MARVTLMLSSALIALAVAKMAPETIHWTEDKATMTDREPNAYPSWFPATDGECLRVYGPGYGN